MPQNSQSQKKVIAFFVKFISCQFDDPNVENFVEGAPSVIALRLTVEFKTSFNYCSSGSGQNSVIPVVCNVPE